MNKWFSISFLIISLFAVSVQAAPATFNSAGTELIKNGEGVRSVFGIKVYRGALYLKSKSSNAKSIISADESMSIRMDITSGLISKRKMTKIILEGFEKSTGSKTAMRSQVNQLLTTFNDGVNKGDIYDLSYVPGKGVQVFKNNKLVVVVPGLKFKQVLFGIWLGKDPAQVSLKKAMLG